jgi:hypothetical protein
MKKLALCIGINDFPGTNSDLNGCCNDAQDWKAVLEGRGFETQMLLDKGATRSTILRIITGMLETGDSIIITNSTHGTQVPDTSGDEPDGFDEAICVISDDQQKIALITDDELYTLLQLKKPHTKLLWIADSCHSGTVTRAFGDVYSGKRRFLPWAVLQYIIHNPVNGKRDSEEREWPCLLMAGCQDNEYCYDDYFQNRPNGAFTKAAIDVLKNLSSSATYNDWFGAIRKTLPSHRHPQTPNLFGQSIGVQIFS